MRTIAIELRKEKRTGIILLMPMAGILGAAYAFTFFLVQKDTLFNLPLPPMDVLLTQAYGMIMVLNMFGIIAAACMIYNMEFKESAMKKMYALPVSVPAMFFCKFLILTIMLLTAICFQNSTLTNIGLAYLPQGTFAFKSLLAFAGYSYITSMPVLSFMIFISSRSPDMWVTLGIGVAGFLSGMALTASKAPWLCIHPFVMMLKPAAAMSAQPDMAAVIFSLIETAFFLFAGLWAAKIKRCA